MTPALATERLSAEERREQIVQAALVVFAEKGYEAASTDEIARRSGISQPYLFRLFSTKRELVLACIEQCFRETEDVFIRAARGHKGEDALHAIGDAYLEMIRSDPTRLRAQLQAYAACGDDVIRRLVSTQFGQLVELVRRLSGVPDAALSSFFAEGMLLNVLAIMRQFEEPQPWARDLIAACLEKA
jgi:AcrR family transcriptional regulator